MPGVGRPKPQPRTHGPRCRALYQYVSQDVDELSFNVNEVIEILMEGVCARAEMGGARAWRSPPKPPWEPGLTCIAPCTPASFFSPVKH